MSLDAFKSLFSEKADANIEKVKKSVAKYEARLTEFNELWPQAMAEAEGLGIGETFVKMFPEGGGFGGGDPFQGLKTEYINLLQYGEPFSPWVKRLYKLESAPVRLKRSKDYLEQVTAYKDEGAESYVLKVRRGIGSLLAGLGNPNKAWDKFIQFGDEFLADPEEEDSPIESYSHRFEPRVDGPSGLLSSPELFIAVKEQGNPLSTPGEESSAINPPTETAEPATTESTTDDAEDMMMQSKTGAGVAGAETSELEVEPALETLPEEIEPVVEETATEETVEEVEGPINAPIETAAPAIIGGGGADDAIDAMMQSKTGAGAAGAGEEITTEETEEPAAGALSVVNNISNVTSSEETTVGGETTNIEDTSATPPPASASPINEEVKEKTGGFGKFLTASLGVTKTPTFGSIMGQLQGGNILGAAGNTINSIKNLFAKRKKKKQERQAAIAAFSAIEKDKSIEQGIGTPEIEETVETAETAEPMLETVSSLETPAVSSLVPPSPVTKEDMQAVGQNISSTISNTNVSNLPAVVGANLPAPTGEPTGTEDSQKGGGTTVSTAGSSNLDTSALEKRLRNIELLLQGPLTVKLQR